MKEHHPVNNTYIVVERYDDYGVRQMTEAEYTEHKATLDRLEEEGLESRNGLLLYNESTKEPYGYDIQRKEQQIDQVVQWLVEALEPLVPNPALEGLSPLERIRARAGTTGKANASAGLSLADRIKAQPIAVSGWGVK